MFLDDIAMIAANTERSKIYLQVLGQEGLYPSHLLILDEGNASSLPGQMKMELNEVTHFGKYDYDAQENLSQTAEKLKIPYLVLSTNDIHSDLCLSKVKDCRESVIIYSGYGGVILKKSILSIGKSFLHAHGGFLPFYKGSTTNYYSFLREGYCGASTLFLNEKIDCGKVLCRKKFDPPNDGMDFDFFDSMIRAVTIVETLNNYIESQKWTYVLPANDNGEVYYVMHPFLRHLVLLKSGKL